MAQYDIHLHSDYRAHSNHTRALLAALDDSSVRTLNQGIRHASLQHRHGPQRWSHLGTGRV